MNFRISAKHMELTDAIREYVQKHGHMILDKFEGHINDVDVVLEGHRNTHADAPKATVNLDVVSELGNAHVSRSGVDLYDLIVESLRTAAEQLRRSKEEKR
jgi:ribosomal subunit interface protein